MSSSLICPFSQDECAQYKCGIFDQKDKKCSLCYLSNIDDELDNIDREIEALSGTLLALFRH